MPKALCYTGLVVSVLIFLVFGLDLLTYFLLDSAFPFGGVSLMMSGGFVVAAGVLGYLSWSTLREQK
ncbi:MAG: hypothetical protein RBS80_26025 [Thermoguttaceae bacterium]|jgi:hypothetical protein|nr:hypothetical protein [Thermoguttaceae bacterium]